MCIGGYDGKNRTYRCLIEDSKLIDCFLDEGRKPLEGIKYSCMELVKKEKAQ